MSNRTKDIILPIVSSFLLAVLFCFKFSVTTSPFYHIDGQDSAIFFIIGKYWAQGSLPYVDLWDHKGPIIFLINCIGYLLTGNKIGVLLIQICSLSIFNYYTYKSFRLYFAPVASYLLIIVSLFWLACSFEGGNLTEEYILPFLSAAIYYVLLWAKKREHSGPISFNPWVAFLLGFILAFSFLTRLTNALGACGIMLGVGIILLCNRQWNNLFKCILFYIAGALVLSLPFFLYFNSQHALNEMLFGTFYYNVSNIAVTSDKNSASTFFFGIDHIKFMIMAINCFGLLFLSLYLFVLKKNYRQSAIVWFFSTLLLSLWYIKSEPMSHYRTIAVPFFTVLFSYLSLIQKEKIKWISRVIMILLVCGPMFITLRKFNSFAQYFDVSPTVEKLKKEVLHSVPANELDRFVLYSGLPSLYLALDTKPVYRNFSFPERQAIKSKELENDIIKEYNSLKAKWILCKGSQLLISPTLIDHYQEVNFTPDNLQGYHLWKLKESNNKSTLSE